MLFLYSSMIIIIIIPRLLTRALVMVMTLGAFSNCYWISRVSLFLVELSNFLSLNQRQQNIVSPVSTGNGHI